MQTATRIAVSAILITSAIATTYHNAAKLRRNGVLNLYPFPRVGRAAKQTWQVPIEDLLLDYKPQQKRTLYAFPRVGRSDVPMDLQQLFAQDLLRSEQLTTNLRDQSASLKNLIEAVTGQTRSHVFTKRGSESTDSTGMWFGPRLGRAYKDNDDEEVSMGHQTIDRSEPELTDQEQADQRKKRLAK